MDTRSFLCGVIPWPTNGEEGFINVHWHKPGMPFQGTSVRTVDELLSAVERLKSNQQNLYFCLSRQARGAGHRSKETALAIQSLFFDVDVEPGNPKKYGSTAHAIASVLRFCQAISIPNPSAMVASGSGGIHTYWFSDRPLTVDEWLPYAQALKSAAQRWGLKFDGAVTADAARVLRIPDTLNWKHDPPKPVRLLPPWSLGARYDFASVFTFAGVGFGTIGVDVPPGPGFTEQKDAYTPNSESSGENFFGGHPLGDVPFEDLGEGLEGMPPLPFEPIKAGCEWLRTAYETGGKEYDQPQWNLTTLCCVFLEDGHELAHKMGNKHAEYTHESTERLWARKNREREAGILGWPSCRAIRDAGSRDCEACPHFKKGKSPLHLALSPAADPRQPPHGGNARGPSGPDPLEFQEVPIDEAVARVNAAGYFVLVLNGDIYRIDPGGGVIVQKREGFTNLFACRQARRAKGTLISAGVAWKCSPKRREFNTIGYWPDNHERPANSYNLWQGWGVEPKQGDWSIIYDHILNVVANGDKAKADFIVDFCAHMVQRPWEKPGVALVLRGRKGTGKTLLTQILARIVGVHNTLVTASGKKLFQQFNWHVADKLLIGAEEAFFAGNHEQNDQLKHLITGDEIEVEQKFGQRISMKSMHRIVMTSNHDQVVAASDDERRFFVCDVSDKRRGDDAYFAPLVRVIKGEDEATLAAFMYELQTRNIKGWKAEKAARNAASIDLARQKLLSLEPPLQWLLEEAQDARTDGYAVGCVFSTPKESQRNSMLCDYREWANKSARVREATDYTSAEKFWVSMKRLLNDEIFPGRRLFRSSGGDRFVIMPSRHEVLEGFNRLLGGKVIDVEEDL
jgi:uncharacterized protein DUF5906